MCNIFNKQCFTRFSLQTCESCPSYTIKGIVKSEALVLNSKYDMISILELFGFTYPTRNNVLFCPGFNTTGLKSLIWKIKIKT